MFRWVAIGLGIIAVIVIGFIVSLIALGPDYRAASRDIFIIILAMMLLVAALLLIVVLVGVLYVLNAVNKAARGNVLPKIDEAMVKVNEVLDSTRSVAGNVQQTASNAANTTGFVTERVVSPVIRISSLISGVRAAATTLARRDAADDLKLDA